MEKPLIHYLKNFFKKNPKAYRSKEEAKSIILANNPMVRNDIWPGMGLNITPRVHGYQNINAENSDNMAVQHDFSKMSMDTKRLLSSNPKGAQALLHVAEDAKRNHWAVGWSDIINTTSYGVTGMDAFYGTTNTYYGRIQALSSQLVKEAVAELGERTVFSKKAGHLQKLESFLKRSFTYKRLRETMGRMPGYLTRRMGRSAPTPNIGYNNARWFRRQIFVPAMKGSRRYFSSMNRLVGKNLIRVGRIGMTTTWFIPTGIGIYNTINAAPADRWKAGLENSFGVVLGAVGTNIGVLAGMGLVTSLTFISGGLAFVIVFICAGVSGFLFGKAGNYIGDKIYGVGNYIMP